MEKGENGLDISNASPDRVLIVANDFLFTMPKNVVVQWGRGFGRWTRLADMAVIDPTVRQYVFDFTWRRGYRVDIVVIGYPEKFGQRIEERLSRAGIAFANLYTVTDVQEIVDSLAYSPDIKWVVHNLEGLSGFAFGPRTAVGVQGLRTL